MTTDADDMLGALVSRYEVAAKIGAGGMGEVYRARDTKLGRDIALKILPDRFRDEPARLSRFEQEVRAVGSLDHPNILAVHDVGIHEGRPYLVSELLEGESLAARMKAGDLTVRRSLEIAVGIAEGLAAAHGRGIIHRDIKPANVFITADGRVKILDFGIAKLVTETGVENASTADGTAITETQAGALVGTPSYMSPEQMRGEPVDQRTDIFSFGVVLYEMLARKPPFEGSNAVELALAVQSNDPVPITGTSFQVPPAVDGVVRRCLEKRPEERFSSAHDIALVLRSILDAPSDAAVDPTPPPKPRTRRSPVVIAAAVVALAALVGWFGVRPLVLPPPLPDELRLTVMPFVADAVADEPYAHAFADTVERSLGFLEDQENGRLWLVGQRTAESWLANTLLERSRIFEVNLGVRGRFGRTDERIRLALEIVDGRTNEVLRTIELDRDPLDLPAFQREPLDELSAALGIEISDETRARLDACSTNVVAAYDPYLRGLGLLLGDPDPADVERAAGLLATATEKDPFFVPAARARADAARLRFTGSGNAEHLAEARRWAGRAIDLAPTEIAGHLALARVERAAGDPAAEAQALERAEELAPERAVIHCLLADNLLRRGDVDAAVDAYERAIFLEPKTWEPYWLLGVLRYELGDHVAAANWFRRAAEVAPDNHWNPNSLGAVMYELERRDEARAAFERSVELEPTFLALSNLGTLEFEEARFGTAARYFERALDIEPDDRETWANLAAARHFGGQPENAVAAFEKAVDLGEAELEHDPDRPALLAELAGSYGMLGRSERGLELARRAAELGPELPVVMGALAEAFEDNGDRDAALEWIGRALEGGLPQVWIERRPALQDLRADPGYAEAVERLVDSTEAEEE